jgi:polyhydroxybutyrate depolymerase
LKRILVAVVMTAMTLASLGTRPAGAATCTLDPVGGLAPRTFAGRTYLLHVPAGLANPAPLMLSLHGAGAGAKLYANNTKWHEYADARRFIVAYPDGSGSPPTWNFAHNSADALFLRQLVAEISSTYCVDPRRVYATGHSNGAIMALRLACDSADVFASVAEYAGAHPTFTGSPCTPIRPISVGIFSSTFDFLSLLPFGWWTRGNWVALNHCAKPPSREAGVLLEATRYSCAGGQEVIWRAYLLQSHNWPGGADGIDIKDRMWQLFVNHPLPV